MNVLQVCAFAAPTPGNFISLLLGLEKELYSKGINTIYAFPERAKDQEWCKKIQKRTNVYFLPEKQARIRLETYNTFKKIYTENDIDIVHSHFELYDIPATIMAPANTKVFWHLHDALKETYNNSSLSRKVLTKVQYNIVGKRVTLLSVSREHATFVERLGLKKDNIYYLPNGIDLSRINIDVIDNNKNRKYFLLFGWEVHRKGVDLLVEAVKNIEREINVKVVGQNDCKDYLRRENVSSSIIFSPPVSDVNELYKETSVFLHISRAEGLSYALLEAIYSGLPVICSEIPENMFAKEFRNITWIPSGDSNELKNALEIVSDSIMNQNKEDISYNREVIYKKYSLNSWINTIINFYLK